MFRQEKARSAHQMAFEDPLKGAVFVKYVSQTGCIVEPSIFLPGMVPYAAQSPKRPPQPSVNSVVDMDFVAAVYDKLSGGTVTREDLKKAAARRRKIAALRDAIHAQAYLPAAPPPSPRDECHQEKPIVHAPYPSPPRFKAKTLERPQQFKEDASLETDPDMSKRRTISEENCNEYGMCKNKRRVRSKKASFDDVLCLKESTERRLSDKSICAKENESENNTGRRNISRNTRHIQEELTQDIDPHLNSPRPSVRASTSKDKYSGLTFPNNEGTLQDKVRFADADEASNSTFARNDFCREESVLKRLFKPIKKMFSDKNTLNYEVTFQEEANYVPEKFREFENLETSGILQDRSFKKKAVFRDMMALPETSVAPPFDVKVAWKDEATRKCVAFSEDIKIPEKSDHHPHGVYRFWFRLREGLTLKG